MTTDIHEIGVEGWYATFFFIFWGLYSNLERCGKKAAISCVSLCCDFDMQHIKQFLYFIEISDNILTFFQREIYIAWSLLQEIGTWVFPASGSYIACSLLQGVLIQGIYWICFTWLIAIVFRVSVLDADGPSDKLEGGCKLLGKVA